MTGLKSRFSGLMSLILIAVGNVLLKGLANEGNFSGFYLGNCCPKSVSDIGSGRIYVRYLPLNCRKRNDNPLPLSH